MVSIKKEVPSPGPHDGPEYITVEYEMEKAWEYLICLISNDGVENLEKRELDLPFWEEYAKATNSSRKSAMLHKLFLSAMTKLPELDLDIEMKIKLFYVYRIPMAPDFQELISEGATAVGIDDDQVLVKYKKEGGLELPPPPPSEKMSYILTNPANATLGNSDAEDSKADLSCASARRFKFTREEELDIWTFLLEKWKALPDEDRKNPGIIKPKGDMIWKEYIDTRQSTRSVQTLSSRFRKIMAPELHKFPNLDTDAKLLLYFGLGLSVPETFLNGLRLSGKVTTDNNGRITMFRPNAMNGSRDQMVLCKREVRDDDGDKDYHGKRASISLDQPPRKSRRLSKAPAPENGNNSDETIEKSGKSPETILPLKHVRIEQDPAVVETIMRLLGQTSSEAPDETPEDEPKETGEDEKIVEDKPEEQQPSTSTPPTETAPKKFWKSVEYLGILKTLIRELDHPELSGYDKKIDKMMTMAASNDARLSLKRMKLIIDASLGLVPT